MRTTRERLANRRYLVVEDQGFQRWMMGNLLESLGAVKVFSAGDGRAALEILESIDPPIDVVLTDLNMPGMDGIEFIRHLARSRTRISLIVASEQDASLMSSVSAMARAYGIDLVATIAKPLMARKLLAALDQIPDPEPAAHMQPARTYAMDEIERGLRDGEFEPFYQPKIDVRSGAVRGVEALARWRHPKDGILLPSSFIPQLESESNLEGLTFALLARAAADCRGWRAAGFTLTIAVNISATSLGDTRMADRVAEIVGSEGLTPRDVILEVTETAAASHPGPILENLSRLRMKGFGLSIDDFGTGYASMQQLAQLPFTELKVDGFFVRNALSDASSRAVLESSLGVAAKLGLPVVAEAVESKLELQLLAQLGCDMAQGFYIARAMSGDDLLSWLLESQRAPSQALK